MHAYFIWCIITCIHIYIEVISEFCESLSLSRIIPTWLLTSSCPPCRLKSGSDSIYFVKCGEPSYTCLSKIRHRPSSFGLQACACAFARLSGLNVSWDCAFCSRMKMPRMPCCLLKNLRGTSACRMHTCVTRRCDSEHLHGKLGIMCVSSGANVLMQSGWPGKHGFCASRWQI